MAKKSTQNKRVTTSGTKRTQKPPVATLALEIVKPKKGAKKLKGTFKYEQLPPMFNDGTKPVVPAKKRGRPAKSEEVKPKKLTTTSASLIQYTGVSKDGKQKVLTVGKGDKVLCLIRWSLWRDLWLCIP